MLQILHDMYEIPKPMYKGVNTMMFMFTPFIDTKPWVFLQST